MPFKPHGFPICSIELRHEKVELHESTRNLGHQPTNWRIQHVTSTPMYTASDSHHPDPWRDMSCVAKWEGIGVTGPEGYLLIELGIEINICHTFAY